MLPKVYKQVRFCRTLRAEPVQGSLRETEIRGWPAKKACMPLSSGLDGWRVCQFGVASIRIQDGFLPGRSLRWQTSISPHSRCFQECLLNPLSLHPCGWIVRGLSGSSCCVCSSCCKPSFPAIVSGLRVFRVLECRQRPYRASVICSVCHFVPSRILWPIRTRSPPTAPT